MSTTLSTKKQFGDFQTPAELAELVWENLDPTGADLIVEPTIGLGSFAIAAPSEARKVPWIGWDLNPEYVEIARSRFAECQIQGGVEVKDVFDLKPDDLGASHVDKLVLVVGNPPWVTSAAQGAFDAPNLPRKWNRFGLNGLDAMTGKSNFDIAEAVILSVAAALVGAKEVRFALLVKRSVALKIARDYIGRPGFDRFRFTRIDSKRWFDVSVEAGLLELSVIANATKATSIDIFDDFGVSAPTTAGIASNGAFVGSLTVYESFSEVEASNGPHFDWRQGLKHDLTKVLELREGPEGLTNGLGETVDIEPDIVSPLYKSSDIAKDGPPRRFIPLYQRDLTGPLPDLALRWPKLAAYLDRHSESFRERRSSIYRGKPKFMLFGVGPYTLSPYKVVISGFYKEAHFRVVGPGANGAPPVVDDTCYLLPFDDLKTAEETARYLNSDRVRSFLSSVADEKAKRPYTKALLTRIRVPDGAAGTKELSLF